MRLRNIFIAAVMLLAFAGVALGAITAEEAKKLGTTLTAVGAEKAGNRDGSIPEYTGGLTTIPPGFKKGSGLRADPFAGEKPLFTITQKNMDKYADKLNDGQKTLFRKYPGYRMDIYKTHRTAALPQYILDNTLKQAATTKTENDGMTLVGAHAAYPFPIPKTGFEAMWNHLVRYNGITYEHLPRSWVVNTAGTYTKTYEYEEVMNWVYWDPLREKSELLGRFRDICTGPPRNAGEMMMGFDSLDLMKGRRIWQYLPGQRRTKLAPDIAFDTPNTYLNGVTTWDEWMIINGSMERFNYKLLGKKEMYVPYNNYKLVYHSKANMLLTPKYLNPDFVRWELHRVWIVEGNLKPGKRHIMSKRRFYLDEDTWAALASEEYDAQGKLYKSGFMYMVQNYDVGIPYSMTYAFYDFNSNMYAIDLYVAETGGVKYIPDIPEKQWLSESLAGSGIR